MVTVKLIARLVDSVGSPLRGKPIYFYYEAASATAVWEPSGGQVTQSSQCQPLFRTGIGVLDKVVLCVGSYGVTVAVLLIAFSVLLLLVRRKR